MHALKCAHTHTSRGNERSAQLLPSVRVRFACRPVRLILLISSGLLSEVGITFFLNHIFLSSIQAEAIIW